METFCGETKNIAFVSSLEHIFIKKQDGRAIKLYQGTGVLGFLFKSTASFMTLTLLNGLSKHLLVKETHDKNI